MERLLLVRCPELLVEDEGGQVLRTFSRIIDAVGGYCPWVTAVRCGVCTLPARGPARFFGGEQGVVDLVRRAAEAVDGVTTVEIGIAEGVFAAHLAAQVGALVPAGETVAFLAALPLSVLNRSDLEELLSRLGIYTLGAFAELPESHVLARLGKDGVVCRRVAGGLDGELPGLRQTSLPKRLGQMVADQSPAARQSGFWGGYRGADARAARALTSLQQLLGVEAVQVLRRQGGRGPGDQIRFVTWNGLDVGSSAPASEPWPGQIPSPAPTVVYRRPIEVEVAGDGREPVTVTGRGALSTSPTRLSIGGRPWTPVVAWAGPWPTLEQWWRPSRRRAARLQIVTDTQVAHLLSAQKGKWWLMATYD